jgi:suppressor of fused protein SUFU
VWVGRSDISEAESVLAMFEIFRKKSIKPSAIKKHINEHVGPIVETIQTKLRGLELVVAEDSKPGYKRLITVGMSSQPMTAEECGQEVPYWSELFISFREKLPEWAAAVLTHLVEMAFNRPPNWTYGDSCHVNAAEWSPGCPYQGFLFVSSSSAKEEFSVATLGKRPIIFLAVVPLHPEEVEFKLTNSTDALLEMMDRFPVEESVDERINCCHPKARAVEESILSAMASSENQNRSLTVKHLAQAGHALEELNLLARASALYQLAQELDADAGPALDRLAGLGVETDEEYLARVRRRLQGLDFAPLTREEKEAGLKLVDQIETGAWQLVRDLLNTDPTTLTPENARELHHLRREVEKVGRAEWVELSAIAALYFSLRVGRDFARLQLPKPWWSDHAELALQAALEEGDDRSLELMSLNKHVERNVESPAAAMNPHPFNALCALVGWWVWCRLRFPTESAPFHHMEVFKSPEVKANAETLVILYRTASRQI